MFFLTVSIFVGKSTFDTISRIFSFTSATFKFETYKCYTWLESLWCLLQYVFYGKDMFMNKKCHFWLIQDRKAVFNSFQWSMICFIQVQFFQTYQPSYGFKIAHFEAYYHDMPVGTWKKKAVNTNILTKCLQSRLDEDFGKKKSRNLVYF